MVKPITIGFVGCGFVAQQCHLPCFSSNPDFKITHLSDPYVDLRQKMSCQYDIPFTFDSHLSLLNESEIDAFVVTLPRPLTFHVVQDLVLSGKSVLAEKPICLNSTYGISLLNQLKDISSHSSVMTGYMKQHDLGFLELKKLIKQTHFSEIISIRAYCFMGNSYASPFGDIKGSSLNNINYVTQSFPSWLPDELHWSFEQFINVFSHITHSVEVLFNSELKVKSVQINDHGEGLILCSIKDKPVCFELIRGEQDDWLEGIVINLKSKQFELRFPPAFLRNTPSILTIREGTNACSVRTIRPQWSWSFYEQAKAFASFVRSKHNSHQDLARAVRQVSLAEQIYQMAFSL